MMRSRSPPVIGRSRSVRSGDGYNNNDSPSRYSRASNDGNSVRQNKFSSDTAYRGDARSGRNILSPRSEYYSERGNQSPRSEYTNPTRGGYPSDGRHHRYDEDSDRGRSGYGQSSNDKVGRSRSRSRHRRSEDNLHRPSDHFRPSGYNESWTGSASRPRLDEAGRNSGYYSIGHGNSGRSRSRSRDREKGNFNDGGNNNSDSRNRRGEDWRTNKGDMASSTPKSCSRLDKLETNFGKMVEKSPKKYNHRTSEKEAEVKDSQQSLGQQQHKNNLSRTITNISVDASVTPISKITKGISETNDIVQQSTAEGNSASSSSENDVVVVGGVESKSNNYWINLVESWDIEINRELVKLDNYKPTIRRSVTQSSTGNISYYYITFSSAIIDC